MPRRAPSGSSAGGRPGHGDGGARRGAGRARRRPRHARRAVAAIDAAAAAGDGRRAAARAARRRRSDGRRARLAARRGETSRRELTDDREATGSSTRSPEARPDARSFKRAVADRRRGPRAPARRRAGASSAPTTRRSSTRSSCRCVLPRRISFVGKAEYMDSWKTKYLFPAMGMIPIDRSGGDASRARRSTPPRGCSSAASCSASTPRAPAARDGMLHQGHTGPPGWRCAPAPDLPVGIIGTREIQPPDAKLPEAVQAGHDHASAARSTSSATPTGPTTACVLRQIIDEVMYEIRELTGQEYVDEYATKKAEALPTESPTCPGRRQERPAGAGRRSRPRRPAAAEGWLPRHGARSTAPDAGADPVRADRPVVGRRPPSPADPQRLVTTSRPTPGTGAEGFSRSSAAPNPSGYRARHTRRWPTSRSRCPTVPTRQVPAGTTAGDLAASIGSPARPRPP